MEYYRVFIKVLLKEIEKFQLDTEVYSTYAIQLTSSLAENFDVPYYRCAFMYRYATCSIYFFNDCIKKFLLEYSNIKDIFSLWKSYSEVKVCSLSVGPGLDYLGFMLAILEYDPAPPNFNGVKIVSKHGAWRNTVNLMLDVFREQGTVFEVAWPNLKYENVDVIQADLLKRYYGNCEIIAVREANVILMIKTLNLSAAGTNQEGPLLHMLKGLISTLKSEAIIFCIDTKPSLAVITQALSHFPGKFLYGPIHQVIKIPAELPMINKCRPSIGARGAFFAWQNLPTSLSLGLHATPLSNISVSTETKEDNLTATCSTNISSASSIKDISKAEDKDPENNSNLPWIELNSFWNVSSPKTKELLKRLMLTSEESLEEINDLISQSEKFPLNTIQTSMLEDIESSKVQNIPLNITQTATLDDEVIPTNLQNQMQDLSVSLQNTLSNRYNLQNGLLEGNSCDSIDSLSPSGTLNSVSSFTSENDSSSGTIEGKSTGAILKSSETLGSYHALDKNNSAKVRSTGDTLTKVISAKTLSCENKVIQTDTHQDISTDSSSVKALTERIKQLAISLESMSQQNEPSCSYDGGDFNEPRETEGLQNFSGTADKPSCSKQSPSCGYKNQDSSPSYESGAEKKICIRNMNCQCCNNRCHMYCCSRSCNFQSYCPPQPVQRCNFSCNKQQSRENNFENFTSPTIVIPVQHISDNALLKIISVLKSESKN